MTNSKAEIPPITTKMPLRIGRTYTLLDSNLKEYQAILTASGTLHLSRGEYSTFAEAPDTWHVQLNERRTILIVAISDDTSIIYNGVDDINSIGAHMLRGWERLFYLSTIMFVGTSVYLINDSITHQQPASWVLSAATTLLAILAVVCANVTSKIERMVKQWAN